MVRSGRTMTAPVWVLGSFDQDATCSARARKRRSHLAGRAASMARRAATDIRGSPVVGQQGIEFLFCEITHACAEAPAPESCAHFSHVLRQQNQFPRSADLIALSASVPIRSR